MVNLNVHFGPEPRRGADTRRRAYRLGGDGEQLVADHLAAQGMPVIERNYRHGSDEIDIIAIDGSELVVVEVKTRSANPLLAPEEAVDHAKRARLIRAANHYVLSHNRTEPLRFDIVTVLNTPEGPELTHLRNAFNIFSY